MEQKSPVNFVADVVGNSATKPVDIQGNKSPKMEENYEEEPQCSQYDEDAEKRKLCPPAQYSLEVLKNLPVRPRKSKIKYLDNFHIFDPTTDFLDDENEMQERIVHSCDLKLNVNMKPVGIQGSKSSDIDQDYCEIELQCSQNNDDGQALINIPVHPRQSEIKNSENVQHQKTGTNIFTCCFSGRR